MGDLDPHLIHYSLSQTKLRAQTASRSVQPILHGWPQSVPILYNGTPFPLKIVAYHGGIWTPSNTYFPGPTRVLNPNSSSISSVIFAWLTSVTDRPTDRPLYCLKMITKMTERDKKSIQIFQH